MKTEKLEAQPPFFFGRWASRYTAAAVKITWTDCSYADTDFSAAKVKDDNKEVDPDKSADNRKNYLNAQIGKGIIENEPPKLIDVTLKRSIRLIWQITVRIC